MTEDEAYKVHIQYTFNAFCKIVIRHAAIDKILKLRRRWEREVSLDYLMNEKFVQLAEPEQLEEYLFTACDQTAVLYHAELAAALALFARADAGRNFPLLFPVPAAASDRRTYRPDTQHSGAAYPACLATASEGNGGEPGINFSPMKQSSKPMRATRTQSTPFFPTTPDISATVPKYTGKSTPRLRNM